MNDYIAKWENKPEKVKRLTDQGIVPMMHDMENEVDVDLPFLMGQVAGTISDIKPAKEIVLGMVREAVDMLKLGHSYVGDKSKL